MDFKLELAASFLPEAKVADPVASLSVVRREQQKRPTFAYRLFVLPASRLAANSIDCRLAGRRQEAARRMQSAIYLNINCRFAADKIE